ncbi:MAG: hypothetical protein KJ737_22780 [Proteobacteria bacterium]|nr:hypothetical protein [Pseudomonadota bacterium]
MKSIHLYNQRNIVLGVMLLGVLFLMVGCAGNETAAGGATETGAITFEIRWPDVNRQSDMIAAALTTTEADCMSGTIRTVIFAIYDKDNNLLVDLEDATFNCSDGEGIVDQVPAGSGIRLVVLANGYNPLTMTEEPFLRGEYVEDITVEADKTTELGIILTYDFEANLTAPSNGAMLSKDQLSFKWTDVEGASTYRIQFTRMNLTGIDPIEFVTSDTSLSIDYQEYDFFVESGLYAWSVAAIDEYGNYGKDSSTRNFIMFGY